MNDMVNALSKEFSIIDNLTHTLNMGLTNKSTKSAVLDLFSQAGGLRLGRGVENGVQLFIDALNEDKLLATKALFYFRDVRKGQGERQLFRTFIRVLAGLYPEIVKKNIKLIPEYGRWDDMYALVGTQVEYDALQCMYDQFNIDMLSDRPSLLGKWLKSENTSSKDSKHLAKITRKFFKLNSKEYRKALTSLRTKINVLEKLISTNQWDKVDYSTVPSLANIKYHCAFIKHDQQRLAQYLADVCNNKKKINANVQFPYEIVRECLNIGRGEETQRLMLDTMWKNQPDYIGKPDNSIVVCDVSGSMSGLPLCVSISLGIYAAERNTGPFHNKFLTFSALPSLQQVEGKDICDKVSNLCDAHWEMNTDIKAVFDTILSAAVRNKVTNENMIKRIFIVSDMEFDRCTGNNNETVFRNIVDKYNKAGYDMPILVFWNVSAKTTQFPMSLDDRGFINISGCSPSIFTNIMKNEIKDPYEMMLDVLNSNRYSVVEV